MLNSIRLQIQAFRKEIRKDTLEEYKKKRREAFIKTLGRPHILDWLQPYAEGQTLLTIDDAFKHCWQALLQPLPQAMQEEAAMGITHHVSFLREVCTDLEQSPRPLPYEEKLLQFTITIMHRFSSEELAKEPEYTAEFYRLMGLLFHRFSEVQGQSLLEWASDCESLWLIGKALIFAEAVNCNTHSKLFSMIQQGLLSPKKELELEALHVLLRILEYCDQRDLEDINEQYSGIPQAIINNLAEKENIKYGLVDYWAPLLYLLSASEEYLLQYAKSGIIAICGHMIATGIESNIFGGLQLLLLFSKARNLLQALLFDEDLQDSKMWLTSCLQNDAYKHPNPDIRKCFARLVRAVMRACHKQQLQLFCGKFVMKNHSLLVWMEWALGEQEDSEVKLVVLQSAGRLLFEEGSDGDKDGDYLQGILAHLHYNGIVRLITALQQHHHEQIRQRSSDLLDRIHQIQLASSQAEM